MRTRQNFGGARSVVWLMPAITLLLSACAAPVSQQPTPAEQSMIDVLEQAQAPTALPPEVSEALLSGANEPRGVEPERFDIAVSNMPADSFFLGLVSGTATNMVVHPEVEGSISLELNDVTVEEVLEVTREVFGYEYARNGGIYTIYPRKMRTEVFPINYLDVNRRGRSDTSVQVGTINSSNNNNRFNNIGADGRSSGNNRERDLNSGARIETTSEADFWTSLEQSLRAIVGSGEGERMVMVNSRTGVVVVKALPSELSAVRSFLDKSQLSASRQVILETKIIEVSLNDEFSAGINWSAIQGEMALAYELQHSNPSTGSSTLDSRAAFSTIFGVRDINELIDLLQQQGHVQVLSSPRISTVNNQKALIRVGSDEFFVTGISNQTTASAAITTTTPTVELDSFFSGIALDVTPQIAENGEVILHVHPVVSEVTDQLKQLTVGDEDFSLPLALREVRESDSIVRARDGQVIVLGGLMQEINSVQRTRRPGFAAIPGLNLLFKGRSDMAQKTELVILMRPIVVGDDSWEKDIRGTEQRIRQIGNDYRSRF